jgi:hypothetical protein
MGANVSAQDINDNLYTPLHLAAAGGHLAVINVLAQMQVPVHTPDAWSPNEGSWV